MDALDVGIPEGLEPAEIAVALAEEQWQLGIHEPPGANWSEIDKFIRSGHGLGWRTKKYTRNGMIAWCGAFVAWCWGGAGLSATARRKVMASTSRLYGWVDGTPKWKESERYIALEDVRVGDVAVVGNGKRPPGDHIVLVIDVDRASGLIETIEGNAMGLGPDGKVYEGVIRRTRPFPTRLGGVGVDPSTRCPLSRRPQSKELMHVYRPLASDLGEAEVERVPQSTRAWQAALVAAGYDLGNYGKNEDGVDGHWGRLSSAALLAFQADHGLEVTGERDLTTELALFAQR